MKWMCTWAWKGSEARSFFFIIAEMTLISFTVQSNGRFSPDLVHSLINTVSKDLPNFIIISHSQTEDAGILLAISSHFCCFVR